MKKLKTRTFLQSILKCYITWMATEHKPKVNKPDKLCKDIQSISHRYFLSKAHMHEINNLPTQKKYVLTVCMILINNRWISRQRRYIKLQGMHMNTAYILAQRSTLILCAVLFWQNWWQKMHLIWQFPLQTVSVPHFFKIQHSDMTKTVKVLKIKNKAMCIVPCLIRTVQKWLGLRFIKKLL
jgi:hypothetical protein